MSQQRENIDFAKKSSTEVKKYYQECFDERTDYWDRVYSDAAHESDDFHAKMLNARMDHAIRMGTEGADGILSVLDTGCGGGILAKRLSHLGHVVYAVDHSYQMVARTKQVTKGGTKHSFVRLGVADIEHLAFEDACFDRVMCLGVLMYLKGYDKAILEIKRVLKPGGMAVLAVSNKMRIGAILDVPLLLKKVVLSLLKKRKALNQCIPHLFNHKLKENGFEILEWRTHGFGPFTLNGRTIFNKRLTVFIDKKFERLHAVPVVSALGYTYIVKAKKRG